MSEMLVYIIRIVILAVVVVGFVKAEDMMQMKWICHSTVCEEGIHFCNEQSKRCEACEDYASQCFSNLQQRNCTKFCMDSRLRQIREQGCKVPTLRHGYQIGSQAQVNYRQRIEVECADGYTMIGEKMLICVEYGQWSSLPICKATTCKLPTSSLVNGYFTFIPPKIHNKTARSEAEIHVGSRLSFHCFEGFRLNGIKEITCISKGLWDSYKLPSCSRENVSITEENGESETSCILPWVLVGIGILSVVTIGIVVACRRKYKETCQSRSTEPKVHKTKNCEANGFVPIDYVPEETNAMLPDRHTHVQDASSTNLKRLAEVSAPVLFNPEDSDVASSSSGETARRFSNDQTTPSFHNVKTASSQQEPKTAAYKRDTGVIIIHGNNGQSAVKQQDGAGVANNDFMMPQNVFGPKVDIREPFPSPQNPPNLQCSSPDTRNGIPMHEADRKKSPVRSARTVEPRSNDAGRSMKQVSMPKQETRGHVSPKTYAIS